MLQNARVTAFTVSELLRKNQQAGKIIPPPRLGSWWGAQFEQLIGLTKQTLYKSLGKTIIN